VLLLSQVKFWLVAVEGVIVAMSLSELPAFMLAADLLRETLLTATALTLTCTAQEAVLLPSAVFTVMVVLPAVRPLTKPLSDTVATAVLPLVHDTFWLVALAGVNTEKSVSVPPTTMMVEVLFKFTAVTGSLVALTVTSQVADLPPSTVRAVIVVFPAFTLRIMPPDTVATMVSLLVQFTSLLLALTGKTVAVRVS
jgi:hypothetical protein